MELWNTKFPIRSFEMKSVLAGIVYRKSWIFCGKSERFSSAINLDAEFSLEERIPLELVESSKFWWDYSPWFGCERESTDTGAPTVYCFGMISGLTELHAPPPHRISPYLNLQGKENPTSLSKPFLYTSNHHPTIPIKGPFSIVNSPTLYVLTMPWHSY